MGIFFSLILMLAVLMIPACLLVFSCVHLYKKLQQSDGDYHNQAFLTALCLCLFVIACALVLPGFLY